MNKVEYKNTLIKDIGRVVTGKTPETKKTEFYGNGYMFITPAELHDGYNVQVSDKCITEAGLLSVKSNCVNGTSVMVGCIGWDMGNVAICHRKCATNQQINSITDFNPRYNPFYTYYWLLTKKDYLFTIASVTRTPILSKSTFEEIVIPMPDRSIQDNVVGILKPIDDMIENNKRIGSELEDMAKTLYDYWFVQFDFPDENGEPYRASGGKMVWNEQLKREIPDGWNLGSVNNLLKIENTSVIPKKYGNAVMEHYSIPAFDDDHNPVYEEASTIESGKYAVDPECILISKLNPQFKRLWDPYCDTANAICSTEFIVYRPKVAWTRPFCYAVLNSDAFYSHMTGKATCSTGSRKRIQPDVSASFELPIPDKKTMHSFTELYAPIMEKRKNLYKENRELTRLRDWLLPMLMNGQVTVADTKEEVSKAIPYAPQTVEVRQAARNFGDTKTDDTADLVQAYLRRKQHDSKTQKRN